MKYQVLQEILLVKGYFERTKDEINYPYPILSINIMYSPARIRTWVVRFLRTPFLGSEGLVRAGKVPLPPEPHMLDHYTTGLCWL